MNKKPIGAIDDHTRCVLQTLMHAKEISITLGEYDDFLEICQHHEAVICNYLNLQNERGCIDESINHQ